MCRARLAPVRLPKDNAPRTTRRRRRWRRLDPRGSFPGCRRT